MKNEKEKKERASARILGLHSESQYRILFREERLMYLIPTSLQFHIGIVYSIGNKGKPMATIFGANMGEGYTTRTQ